MITATVRDLVTDKLYSLLKDDSVHSLYIVRDNETVFYVGKSQNCINRLWQHLGKGNFNPYPSLLGKFILVNTPQSFDFQIELLTPGDVLPHIQKNAEYRRQKSADYWKSVGDDYEPDITFDRIDVEIAEETLIGRLSPCFNDTYNHNPTSLPESYIDPRKIAVNRPKNVYSFDLSRL